MYRFHSLLLSSRSNNQQSSNFGYFEDRHIFHLSTLLSYQCILHKLRWYCLHTCCILEPCIPNKIHSLLTFGRMGMNIIHYEELHLHHCRLHKLNLSLLSRRNSQGCSKVHKVHLLGLAFNVHFHTSIFHSRFLCEQNLDISCNSL